MDKFWRPLGKETESKCIWTGVPTVGIGPTGLLMIWGRPIAVKGTSDIRCDERHIKCTFAKAPVGRPPGARLEYRCFATPDVGSVLRAFAA